MIATGFRGRTPEGIAVLIVLLDAALWAGFHGVLGAPSGGFYPAAALCFVVIPVAGAWYGVRTSGSGTRATVAKVAGGAVGLQLALFVGAYGFAPYFLAVRTVHTPASCDGTYTRDFRRVPVGEETGILLNQDADVRVVAVVDRGERTSTVHVVRRSDGSVLFSKHYPDDTVAVAVHETTVFLFHDALGTWIDKRNGRPARENSLMSIDSYGRNLGNSFEATGYFSFWWDDGSVQLLRKLTFSGFQGGCFVDGRDDSVHQL